VSDLRAAQAAFWRAVRTEPAATSLDEHFVGAVHFTAAQRLEVYRTAYWVRQVSALGAVFPRVAHCLGDGPFARTASRYLGAFPSTSSAIEGLAQRFPDWVRGEHPALTDLASFELAAWEVAVAIDEPQVSAAAASSLDLTRAHLTLGRQVRVLRLHRGLLEELGHPTAAPAADEGFLAVWRDGFDVVHREVTPGEHDAIGLAQRGASFVDLCAVLASGGDAAFIHRVLAAWFERGWVAHCVLSGD